jgi:large subunit ribosomal protein L24
MSKVHVKKNDVVYVISGKDEGKKGRVLNVDPKTGRILVEGVNIQTKHSKPKSAKQAGGRIKQEGRIHSSNVLIFCDKCDNPTRIGKRILESGDKARICKKCGEVIDIIKETK